MGVQKWTPIFHAQIQKGGDAMYFTSGQDRAFERLMQEKPGFDHYDGGGANAPEDCGSCRFYRPDWKYTANALWEEATTNGNNIVPPYRVRVIDRVNEVVLLRYRFTSQFMFYYRYGEWLFS